jgi:MFS family permease
VNVTINLITEIVFIDSIEDNQRNTWDVATYWAAGCILLPLIGFLADRYGKRALMVI